MLAPMSPRNDRLELLASVQPGHWYFQHLADDRDCWCSVGGPDETCDTGEALWRLALAGNEWL